MPRLLLLVVVTLAALFTAAQTVPAATTYPYCNLTFSCGPITNATFPFTGGDRPSYCGPPEFALTCRDGAIAELTHNSLVYRVHQLNQSQEQTLVLSRSDLYYDICTSELRNTTFNPAFFTCDDRRNEALGLFYDCNSSGMNLNPSNTFYCNSPGFNSTYAYYSLEPVPRGPICRYCGVTVIVPVSTGAVKRVGPRNALSEGFAVNYSVPNQGLTLCQGCQKGLGGNCGFKSGQPICICDDDRPCPFPLTGRNRLTIGRIIGISVAGTVLACVGLGLLIFYCRRRTKLRLTSRTAKSSGKGFLSIPSGNLTSTIPSYPSSKSLRQGNSYFGVHVFNCTELEEATNNFDPSRQLGEGGFGTVFHGLLSDGRIVAVKRLYEKSSKRLEQFMNEVEILTRLSHGSLVKLYGCTSRQSRELLLVYEYIPNGTVAEHLHGKRASSGLLSWPVRLNIAVETADALTYLHESKIIHRDVKTNNILLDNDFHVKVADFGLSRLFPNGATHVSTAPQGTPGYVDPEYHICYKLTEKSDVYSFGVVLIELISSLLAVDTDRNRYDINLSNMAVSKIQSRMLHELVDPNLGFETDSNVRRMVTLVAEIAFRCLQQERDMRPSMEEVLEELRGIQNAVLKVDRVEILDIRDDDVELLKGKINPAASPDCVTADK